MHSDLSTINANCQLTIYEILDRLNTIKRPRHEDEIKLNELVETREHLTSLADAKVKLSELYHLVLDNLYQVLSEPPVSCRR